MACNTAQYSPSSSLTLNHLKPIFLFRNRIDYLVLLFVFFYQPPQIICIVLSSYHTISCYYHATSDQLQTPLPLIPWFGFFTIWIFSLCFLITQDSCVNFIALSFMHYFYLERIYRKKQQILWIFSLQPLGIPQGASRNFPLRDIKCCEYAFLGGTPDYLNIT